MAEPNYAGNIIVNLASLPDFLRKPILKKRMVEFFDLPEDEKVRVISNALEAGPDIPFPNFSKLFKTWLEILATLPAEQREGLFGAYIDAVAQSPEKLIRFHLDGILEIFLMMNNEEKKIISHTIVNIINMLSEEKRRIILLLIPDNAKKQLGI